MILVTGGTGLLGAHLLIDLLENNDKIRAIYRSEESLKKTKQIFSFYNEESNIKEEQIEWIRADITDADSLEEVFNDVSEVYHCAAKVSFIPKEKASIIRNNVLGTKNLINLSLANKVQKFCHVSSIASLGGTSRMKEISELNEFDFSNNSGYAISKYLSELEVWRGIEEGLHAVMVNPTIILGPGDWNSGAGEIFSKIYKGMPFYSEGINGFVDVRDVTRAMILLMEKGIASERFIISENNYPYKQVFEMIAKEFNKKLPFIKVNSILTSFAWRVESAKSFFIGTRPIVTKESVKSAVSKKQYSNKKFTETIGFNYTPIQSTVHHIASCFLSKSQNK